MVVVVVVVVVDVVVVVVVVRTRCSCSGENCVVSELRDLWTINLCASLRRSFFVVMRRFESEVSTEEGSIVLV